MELNNKKIIRAWTMYDWANSVYSLTVTSVLFPIYYQSVAVNASGGDRIDFFGFEVVNSVLYSYSLAFSFLFVALILPLLSGMADYSGRKKLFMMIFMYIGSLSCIGMYFFNENNVEWGILCSVFASIGYSGSLVFYDAFLPEIATEDRYDKVSAQGYAMGYIGGVILLIFNLLMIQMPDLFFPLAEKIQEIMAASPEMLEETAREQAVGYYQTLSTKISFLSVGVWWIAFSQIPFLILPKNIYNRKVEGNVLTEGYREIIKVWHSLKHLKITKNYLRAFFFYNMGVQTVMYLAATFGNVVLKLADDMLILTILVIQLVAVIGAFLFARISKLKGNKFALVFMVCVWMFVCVFAYFTTTLWQFFTLAFIIGMIMGGIQSLSRSTYSKLIPKNTIDHTSYFSFYDVAYNLSIFFGTFSYGFVTQMTEMRNTVLVLGLFFVIGLYFLNKVTIPKSDEELLQDV